MKLQIPFLGLPYDFNHQIIKNKKRHEFESDNQLVS